MPKQTNNSSNNAALKGFALTLIILILAVCVMAAMTEGFTNWNPYGWFDKPAEEQQTPEGDDPAPEQPTEEPAPIDTTITNSEHVMLAMSAAVTAAEGEYVEQTLTATVTPSTAQEKGVDWTVAWADGSDVSDLSDYLTITPASDGSNICYVRAYAAFDKDIIITVTTRDGGYSATCTVSFVGNPSDMEINVSGMASIQDSGWGQKIYQVKTGQTYSLDISLNNIFDQVDPSFVPQYSYEVIGVGTFKLTKSTNDTQTETLTLSPAGEVTYYNSSTGRDTTWNVQDQVMGVSISDNQLKINPYGVISAISSRVYTNSNRTNFIRFTFDSYSDNTKLPYYQIKVTETQTGISETINVRVISGVNGVSLSQSSMTF